MATKQLVANWSLEAFNTENNTVDKAHNLAVPLQSVMPSSFDQAWESEAIGGTNWATLQLGDSLNERKVMIKYEDEFEGLLDLLRKCILRKNVYDLRIKDGTNRDATKIVQPTADNFGADMFNKGEFYKTYREINFEMTVRKIDGSKFNIPSLRGPDQAI